MTTTPTPTSQRENGTTVTDQGHDHTPRRITTVKPPPSDRRCQVYDDQTSRRCRNQGTHWSIWGEAGWTTPPLHSWECDGPCTFPDTVATDG